MLVGRVLSLKVSCSREETKCVIPLKTQSRLGTEDVIRNALFPQVLLPTFRILHLLVRLTNSFCFTDVVCAPVIGLAHTALPFGIGPLC